MSLREVTLTPLCVKPVGICLFTAAVLLSSNVSQAADTDGKCYHLDYTVDEYKTVKDKIVAKQASSSFSITLPSLQDTTARVKVKEAYSDFAVTQPVYRKDPITIKMQDARTDIEVIPVSFDTVTEKVLVQEAYTKLELIPQTFKIVDKVQLLKKLTPDWK